ncbi:probable pectinesterase/pectinesterase inhibitor 61 [Papaver somniferum]|uniref:probable pectinesterase/pectinesterase inhibitor 61 n=1 Tax=Papaver somniferum TaxID=3469 RepID=UPI000E6F5BCC|nr:probable pectinesterase/pectinesterase inhibitor 61 [Papaver somniferum]
MFKHDLSIILTILFSLLITTTARPATFSAPLPSPAQGLQRVLSRNGSRSITQEWRFLNMSLASMKPDFVVANDGTGTFRTITEAINAVPDRSSMRTVIYIKAGKYEEQNLEVGSQKTNVVMIGDGINRTIITGGKSVKGDHISTYHTASFAATGDGFMAMNITFENWAGPLKEQAVAVRVSSDRAIFYRCSFWGFQDTLYVYSKHQFFRECDIYGTIDFIFGDSTVVIQSSRIYARKPLPGQWNAITAQNRKNSTDSTGIVIHNSQILPAPELKPFKNIFQTYLGRPWANYSQVVYMGCFIEDHISPQGWIPWSGKINDTVPDTIFYAEFNNSGPGGLVDPRVNWTGYHRITTIEESQKFTSSQFILGSEWLPASGVPFTPGLSD